MTALLVVALLVVGGLVLDLFIARCIALGGSTDLLSVDELDALATPRGAARWTEPRNPKSL